MNIFGDSFYSPSVLPEASSSLPDIILENSFTILLAIFPSSNENPPISPFKSSFSVLYTSGKASFKATLVLINICPKAMHLSIRKLALIAVLVLSFEVPFSMELPFQYLAFIGRSCIGPFIHSSSSFLTINKIPFIRGLIWEDFQSFSMFEIVFKGSLIRAIVRVF